MKRFCAFFFALAVALTASAHSERKLSGMREGETMVIEYAYLNSIAVDDRENMRIRIKRGAREWTGQFEFLDREIGVPVTKSIRLAMKTVDAMDRALEPRVYGEDDIQLSGEHVIVLRWPDSEPQTLKKTGDDDRFMKIVWGLVSKKKKPNQPPQRNAGSRPSSDDSQAFETPSSLGPRG